MNVARKGSDKDLLPDEPYPNLTTRVVHFNYAFNA